MQIETLKDHENKPIKIILKDSTIFFGSFKIIDESSIELTDRYYKKYPIDINFISLIQQIDNVRYVGDSNEI